MKIYKRFVITNEQAVLRLIMDLNHSSVDTHDYHGPWLILLIKICPKTYD